MSGPGLSGIHLLPEELLKYSGKKKKEKHCLIEVILQIQFEGREPAQDLQRGCKRKQEKMNSSSQAGLRRQARTADRPWGHSQSSNKHGRPPPPGQAALGDTQSTRVLSGPGGLVGLWSPPSHRQELPAGHFCPESSGAHTRERGVVSAWGSGPPLE